MLDFDEYLHLAIHASQNNAHHSALEYLHKALDLSPNDARAIFLLAAEHAELGLYSRAISEMERCILIDPGIEMAYYQLGLLYIQTGRRDESLKMWDKLSASTNYTPLKIFASGMLVIEADQAKGLQLLTEAAQMQNENVALKGSIENIIKLLSSNQHVNSANEDDESYNALFLNAYKKSNFDIDET